MAIRKCEWSIMRVGTIASSGTYSGYEIYDDATQKLLDTAPRGFLSTTLRRLMLCIGYPRDQIDALVDPLVVQLMKDETTPLYLHFEADLEMCCRLLDVPYKGPVVPTPDLLQIMNDICS